MGEGTSGLEFWRNPHVAALMRGTCHVEKDMATKEANKAL
jgi:hypothetical protein